VFGVAVVCVAASAAWAVTGLVERSEASNELARLEAVVPSRARAAADANVRLERARATVRDFAPDVAEILSAGETVAHLDDQELAFVRDAFAAGLVGNVAAYNRAQSGRNALDAPHDAAVEGLRVRVDALTAAMAGL
jgi:hypothetical protein